MTGYQTAEVWNFVRDIPNLPTSVEKKQQQDNQVYTHIYNRLIDIKDEYFILWHLTFVCSLIPSEAAGIKIDSIDFDNQNIWK
mgnify:CR=1 FL=1